MRINVIHVMCSGDRWVCSRLRQDERGIALVMALIVIMVLAIVLTTVISLTASGSRDASRTNAGQKALAIAEAGLNNALAQIGPHYPSDTGGDGAWVSGPSGSFNGGTVSWTGAFSGSDWTITGTGTVPNPTGPGATSITRTVSALLHVSQVTTQQKLWGIYSDDPNAQCTALAGNVSVNVPIFVRNCLSAQGTFSGNFEAPDGHTYTPDAKIWDPPPYKDSSGTTVFTGGSSAHTVSVEVVHGLSFQGGAAAGTAVAGTTDHRLAGVDYGSPTCCQMAVHALTESNSPTVAATLPTLNASTLYSGTSWGAAACTLTGGATNPFDTSAPRNNTGGNLFPGSGSYNCSLTDSTGKAHSIAYDASTHAFSITNSWFIDSDVTFPNTTINYTGQGTLYIDGTVTLNSQSKLCASSDCQSWDPTNSANPNLLIVALNASSTPQGTAFSLSGQAMLEANTWTIGNNSGDTSPTLPTVACGSSGASPAFTSTGGAYIGGSVWTQKGCPVISGGGVLHTAVALPSGSPLSSQYDLLTPISAYKGG
jgi:type II secretory pathway pseudopilin PulG